MAMRPRLSLWFIINMPTSTRRPTLLGFCRATMIFSSSPLLSSVTLTVSSTIFLAAWSVQMLLMMQEMRMVITIPSRTTLSTSCTPGAISSFSPTIAMASAPAACASVSPNIIRPSALE